MAHSVSEDELAKSVSDAVRKLRKELGESQQQFAYRMKTAIRTVARYETVRPPKGKVLRQLATMSAENNLPHLADVFRGALNQELGMRNREKRRIQKLAKLYLREQMALAYDEYVKAINDGGCTVNAIRLEIDASDGTTFVADIAPPELQKVVGTDGKRVTKKVPRNYEIGPSIIHAGLGDTIEFYTRKPTP
jgi:transcriptional regulator with XRE-family HTH domain